MLSAFFSSLTGHTNEWPSGVTNGAVTTDLPLGVFDSYGSSSTVSELVAEIKPR